MTPAPPFRPLQVLERSAYGGPNVYTLRPMLRVRLDLGTLEDWPSSRLPGFTDALLAGVPTLETHGCSYREAGGFVRRLREGTWLGHVVEHLALELQTLAGERTSKGRTRSVRGQSGVYDVLYAYRDERVGFLAGLLALRLVDSLLPPDLRGAGRLEVLYRDPAEPALTSPQFDLGEGLAALRRLVRRTSLGPRTEATVQAARRRGIPVQRLDEQGLVQFGQGHHARWVRAGITDGTSHGGGHTAGEENAPVARTAALAVALDGAGVDLIPLGVRETGGGVAEVNRAPDLRMHLRSGGGPPRDVGRAVIDQLYPKGSRSRVPVFAVTGTNGKTTTVRMVAHVLTHAGHTVGFTNTSGVYVGPERVYSGDASGPRSARMVLGHPAVTAAVLETARGGVLREGLGFDRADVGAVLNVQSDHLGMRGIDTLGDLARVKAVVARAVARRGVSVLNADDPRTLRMRRIAGGQVALFSMRGVQSHGLLRAHVDAGGLAVTREEGDLIVIHDAGERVATIPATDIPATLGGLAHFNVENALAAVAMCYGYGLDPDTIRAALSTFTTSFEQSPGRFNVYGAHPFRVVLDYAHNPAALAAQREVLHRLRSPGARLIGMVSIPGDRREDDIREIGASAAGTFDEIVFREGADGRGRPRGETMELMRRGALAAGFPEGRIHLVLDEQDAVEATLRLARPGDIAVIMPTNVDAVWGQIKAFTPSAGIQQGEEHGPGRRDKVSPG